VHSAKRLATAESELSRSLMRPDFSEQLVFANQFQRNGVIRGQHF
jgi:hypothetical protein